MAKRFIDTSRYRQAWRKLDPRFRAAYSWLVENADAAGFWIIDLDHFKFECGYALDLERFLRDIAGAVVKNGAGKLLVVDFVQVNYGELREGYNPHKPALRALAASKISSLNQASTKLEDEEEKEDEGEDIISGKEHAREAEVEPTFDQWFGIYDKRRAVGECRAKWATLDQPTREAIMEHTGRYVKAQPDKTYRKDPLRYLSKRGWEDEVVTAKAQTNGQSTEQDYLEKQRMVVEANAKFYREQREFEERNKP